MVAVGAQGTILQSDPFVELELQRASQMELTVTGPAGLACRIETATHASAGTNWLSAASLTLTNGAVTWALPPTNEAARFYRVVAE